MLPKYLKVIDVDRKRKEESVFQKNWGGLLTEDANKAKKRADYIEFEFIKGDFNESPNFLCKNYNLDSKLT